MLSGRAILTAILGVAMAACGTGAALPRPPATPTTEAPDVAVTASTASPTAAITLVSPSPSLTVRPTPKATPVLEPPKPTGLTFETHARESADGALAQVTQTVSWRTPRTPGVEIRVYGVTTCLAEPLDPPPGTSGPCLVEHTALPASVRTLLATAWASDGLASWTWTEESGCNIGLAHDPDGPAYSAIVLAAYGASGHSIFAIAEPGGWWRPGPNDTVC
jgi:hypothetical protein